MEVACNLAKHLENGGAKLSDDENGSSCLNVVPGHPTTVQAAIADKARRKQTLNASQDKFGAHLRESKDQSCGPVTSGSVSEFRMI